MKLFSSSSVRSTLAIVAIAGAFPVAAEICFSRDNISLDTDPFTPSFSSERIDFEMPRTGTLEVITDIASNSVSADFFKIVQVNGANVYVADMAIVTGEVDTGPLAILAGANVQIEYDIRTSGAATFDVAIDIAGGCGSATPFVVDDFSDAAGGGVGWAPESGWGGSLTYLEENAIEPRNPQHVRTDDSQVFRTFSPEAISAIQGADDVWIGFLARFDRNKEINSFAGVSVFSDQSERLFAGGGFSVTQWSLTFGFKEEAGEETSAEWSHVLIHADFEAEQTILYLNGRPRIIRESVPSRNWTAMRLANGGAGSARLYVDNLKVGETREAVESPLPPLLYSSTFTTVRERNYGAIRDTDSLLYGDLDSFTPRLNNIRAMASDEQGRVFTGHPSSSTVIVHDRAGNEITSWNAPSTLQSMDRIENELVIGSDAELSFHDPLTGNITRTLSNPCTSGLAPGGLAFDGTNLWAICDGIIQIVNPSSGAVTGNIPNVAFNAPGCPFGSQRVGLAATAPGELTIGCTGEGVPGTSGWRIRSSDGSIIDSTAQDLGAALAVRLPILNPAVFSDRFESY